MLATYYDTADLALARAGVTLRHRRGEPGDPWTVKLAGAAAGSAIVRNELVFAGAPGRIPAQVADVVRALVRGRSLAPVARLRTVRTVRELRDDAGNVVVEIADDRVTAYEGRRRVARFRELEVELKSEGASQRRVLDGVVERLVDVGAERSRPMSKLVRALGPAARAPADVVVGEVRKRSDSADFVRHVIAGSVARMLEHDPALRVGAAGSDVHAFRVATRRLRSDLRTFGPLLDGAWVARLRDELKWIADVVGAVRDADVLEERLRDHSSPLTDVDAVGAQELLVALRTQRATARDAMLSALRSAAVRRAHRLRGVGLRTPGVRHRRQRRSTRRGAGA
jgi:inorganic triphosphatase YgiF